MESSDSENLLRALPAVQRLLEEPAIRELQVRFGRDAVVSVAREILAEIRNDILGKKIPAEDANPAFIASAAVQKLVLCVQQRCGGGVRRAINATGVILHTGLGRAVLPASVIREISSELSGYAVVETDVVTGKRGTRDETVRSLLCMLLGCKHATVVNNNAAATLLALAAITRSKEVIVSRGQLVEIGGSFRVPDVMREGGCKLVEVGTTNRTRLADYEAAITPDTAALMLVHSSNFRIVGFTEEVGVRELSALARERNLPLIYDLGSGALLDGMAEELRDEPSARRALDEGADLVLFSADKILGGPQGGIAAGKPELVERMRRHPLYRAFRVDKLTLRALETTLRLCLDPDRRNLEIPTLRMLRRPLSSIEAEAMDLVKRLKQAWPGVDAECMPDSSRLGSGSLPERNIPTIVVALRQTGVSAEMFGERLRAQNPPIFTRIQDGRILIDPRTLLPGESNEIVDAISKMKMTMS